MTELIFRPLRQDDEEGVRDFFSRLGDSGSAFFNHGRGNERRTMGFFENGKPDHRFFVSCIPGDPTPAGLCFIWDVDSSVPWLGIAVREDCRGMHVGSFTLDRLISYVRERGCGGLLLTTAQTNFPAQRLYESRGFERLGVYHDGEYVYIRRFPAPNI